MKNENQDFEILTLSVEKAIDLFTWSHYICKIYQKNP